MCLRQNWLTPLISSINLTTNHILRAIPIFTWMSGVVSAGILVVIVVVVVVVVVSNPLLPLHRGNENLSFRINVHFDPQITYQSHCLCENLK